MLFAVCQISLCFYTFGNENMLCLCVCVKTMQHIAFENIVWTERRFIFLATVKQTVYHKHTIVILTAVRVMWMTHTHLPSSRFGVSTGHIRLHSTDEHFGAARQHRNRLQRTSASAYNLTHTRARVRARAVQHGKHQNCTHICASHTRITVAKKHEYYNNILANQRVHSCWNGWCMTVCGWACVRVCVCVFGVGQHEKLWFFFANPKRTNGITCHTCALFDNAFLRTHTHGNEFKYLCHFFVVVHTNFSTVSSYTQKIHG